ncbi:DUF4214 domain-containing protein [Pseudomonas putida]|uniref:DUF4214 domain-containing protein n=1 Tax=Pseudomonas putida TaxID=303 RepID=UPI00370BE788
MDQVQQLYIAYFGRPADPFGQRYWAQVIDDAGGDISNVLAGFSASNESQALYSSSSTVQNIIAIYSNVFNRAPEAAGLAYWTAQVESGKVSQAQAAWAIQQAAGPGDASTVNNKLIAANLFTNSIDTAAEIAGYNGAQSAAVARAFLNKVDANYASIANLNTYTVIDVAAATGTGTIVPPAPVLPTFTATATAGVVTFSGNATGDISVSWSGAVGNSVATFSRAGVSSSVTFGGGNASSVSLASTEVLAGNAANLIGLTVTGLGSIKLSDTAANLNNKIYAAQAGGNDVLTVTDAPSVATSLASLSGFETVNLSGSTAEITAPNGAGITVNNTGSVSAVLRLGTGGQIFNGGSGTYTVRDGSGNDTINPGAGNYTLLPGGGTDTFKIGAGTTASLSGLSSTDTAVVSAGGTFNISSSTYTASAINTVNNGTFAFTNATNVNLSLASGSNGFTITGGTGINTLVGSSKNDILSAGVNNNTLTGGAGNDTFNVAASTSGKSTTITDLGTGDTVVVGSTGVVTANNISTFVATAATVNNAASNASVVLNTAAAGGTVDLHLATGSTGFTITGGAGTDTLIGSSKSDIITSGAGADTLTGGAGADTFVYTTAAHSVVTAFDSITDFVSGTDTIKTGVANGATSLNQGGGYTAAGTGTLATDIAAAVTAGNGATPHTGAANDAYVVTISGTGAGKYIFQDTDGDGAVGAGELVIKLTGTSSTTLVMGDFVA